MAGATKKGKTNGVGLAALNSNDVVIAVMGITGSGKSSFIDLLVDESVSIGHDLSSHTSDVGIYSFKHQGSRKVYLIDTPGFDDTTRTDTQVLKDVAFFLSQTYSRNVQLTGIIYLHRITDNRMPGSGVRNLAMLKKLCGDSAYHHVFLATTMWGNLGPQSGEMYATGLRNEEQLIELDEYWGVMAKCGSQVHRHAGTAASALKIVSDLIAVRDQKGPVILEIQREMVDRHMNLEDTAAGREVEKELQQMRESFQEQLHDLEESYKAALDERDQKMAEQVEQQRKAVEVRMKQADLDREELQMNFERLAAEKTEQYNRLLQQLQTQEQQYKATMAKYENDLQQLKEKQKRDAELFQKQRMEFEQKLREADQTMNEKIARKDSEGARRIQAEKDRYQRQLQEIEERFQKQAGQQQHEAEMIQEQIIQEGNRKSWRDYVMPVLGILAGIGDAIFQAVGGGGA